MAFIQPYTLAYSDGSFAFFIPEFYKMFIYNDASITTTLHIVVQKDGISSI